MCRLGPVIQGIWAGALVLPRTVKTDAAGNVTGYGNLYGNLLDYVISAALIFYILTIAGIFVLRRKRPDAERPYKAFGYPIVPALYIIGATVILARALHLSNRDHLARPYYRADRRADLFPLEKSKSKLEAEPGSRPLANEGEHNTWQIYSQENRSTS